MKSVMHLMAITVTVFASAQEINSNRSDQLLPSVDFTSTNFAPIHATYTSVTATPNMVSNSPTSSCLPVVTSTNVPRAATLIPPLAESAETSFVTSPQPISISPAQQTANLSHEPTATAEHATVSEPVTTNEDDKKLGHSTSQIYMYDLDAVESFIAAYGSPVSMRIIEVDENDELYYLTSPQVVTHSPSQPVSGTTIQPPPVPSIDSITTVESVRTATVDMIMPESASKNVKTVYVTVTSSLTSAASPTAATTPMITPPPSRASTSPHGSTATSQTPTPTAEPPGPEKGSAAEIIAAIFGVINALYKYTLTILSSIATGAVGYVAYKRSSTNILLKWGVLEAMMVTLFVAAYENSSSIDLAFEIVVIVIAIVSGLFLLRLAFACFASMRSESTNILLKWGVLEAVVVTLFLAAYETSSSIGLALEIVVVVIAIAAGLLLLCLGFAEFASKIEPAQKNAALDA